MGAYQVFYIYNNETISTAKIALVKIDLPGQKLYFSSVVPTSNTRNIACRRISQRQVVVGPNGCSSPLNPSGAIQSSNCIENEVDVQKRIEIFNRVWYYSKEDIRCKLYGGNGDPRLCIGPMRLSLDNSETFIPKTAPTAKQLLASRMIFVETLMGPFAMIPAVVQVPLILPEIQLVVTSGSCPDFQQNYMPWGYDPYTRQITDVWMAFKGTTTTALRILLQRAGGDTSVNFRIVLGDSVAAGSNYTFTYQSPIIYAENNGVLLITRNWIDLIDFDTPYVFSNITSGAYACTGVLSIVEPVNPYQLEELYPLTSANYSKNAIPRVMARSRMCNYRQGRTDATGNSVFPYVLPGDKAGGDALFASPEFPNLRYFVPPNPFLSFDTSCATFYSKNETLLDYGTDGIQNRNSVPRINYVAELCNADFLVDELVSLGTNPNERFLQCFKQGGWLAATESYCSRGITTVLCKLPFVYFDGKCIYKFSPTTETRYAAALDTAAIKCSQLNDYALPIVEVDIYLDAWLRTRFLYLSQDLNNFAYYRVPQFQSDKCTCYSTLTKTKISDCSCYGVKSDDGLIIFPICYYPANTPELEPDYWDVGVSLQTAITLIKGQEGPMPNGLPAICRCFDGSSGQVCEKETCVLKDVLERNPADLNQLATFFQKCYTDNHGDCSNGQPRVCKCNYPYAPNAATLSTLPSLFQFIDTPCSFPASVQPESLYFQIGDTFYDSLDPFEQIPCGGISQGVALVSNATGRGVCACASRVNAATGVTELGYKGKACSCEIAILPYGGASKNGLIVGDICNNRGTCCPFGQSVSNPIFGDINAEVCFDPISKEPLSGCVGDNGWGGESSTCPVPFDFAFKKPRDVKTFGGTSYTYVDLGQVYFIQYIRVRDCDTPTAVQISNDVGVEAVPCVFNSTIQLYECDNVLAKRFVVVVGDAALECYVQAYEEMFEYCGANGTVNPFAGTFFNIPLYRSDYINEEQQYTGIASFGCTNTDCMCDPNHNGKKCRTAVSSVRPTLILDQEQQIEIEAQRFCGEEILVPALENPVRSRGFIDETTGYCQCNSISNVDATGRIGRVLEKFTGTACQCFDVYNPDTKEIEECAGHGFCEPVEFPYGRCEVDLDEFIADSLFKPFTVVTSTALDYVEVEFLEDSYFYGDFEFTTTSPTANPTKNPTLPTRSPTTKPTRNPTTKTPTDPTAKPSKNPTANPTRNPTVKPTANPTPAYSEVVLYNSGSNSNGAMSSSIAALNAVCSTQAGLIGLSGCSKFMMLIEKYSGYIDSFPSLYEFSPSVPIVSYDQFIGSSTLSASGWTGAFAATPFISLNLNSVGVVSGPFWTGYRGSNCLDFSTSSSGQQGRTGSQTQLFNWVTFSNSLCNANLPRLCVCLR